MPEGKSESTRHRERREEKSVSGEVCGARDGSGMASR